MTFQVFNVLQIFSCVISQVVVIKKHSKAQKPLAKEAKAGLLLASSFQILKGTVYATMKETWCY